MKEFIKKIGSSRLEPLFRLLYAIVTKIEYAFFDVLWALKGYKKPSKADIEFVCENVTFMVKSFERQGLAKGCFRAIQRFYPDVRVVIADDSQNPLKIDNENATVLNLPFNTGLSYGLNRALEQIDTPFLVRLDDDIVMTRRTTIADQLRFLMEHNEVDLVGFADLNAPKCRPSHKSLNMYYKVRYRKELIIPRLTKIDDGHTVVAKTNNYFLARTDKIKQIGYDDNIRMIEHNEFFYRAAGKLVCVVTPESVVFHRHNPFDSHYREYRSDWYGDKMYIMKKHNF